MPKINLLYVITKLELGGAQKQLLSLIYNLDKEIYNIFLFTAKDGLLIDEALAIDKITLHRSGFLERSINPFKDILALIELFGFIKKNRIQIVHTHSSKAGVLGRLAAWFARTPAVIHTVHGWSFHDHQSGIINYFYLILERICATFTGKIIVVSDFDRNKGLKNSIGWGKQYIVIRYGIDEKKFENKEGRNDARKALKLNNADLAVGMIACFKPQKSPLDFIKLAAAIRKKFPDVKFILVGDGLLRTKVSDLVKDLNLEEQIVLAGWRNDIPLILSALDIFVLTSLWEGLPIVVLEAMAAGLPIVATDTGGIGEALTDGQAGYLVQPGKIASMQEKVEELLRNPQRRDEFGKLSKAVIDSQKFSLSNMVKHTQELYSDLLEESYNA